VNDCARCHADTGSFATLAFEHDRDSRFKLDAQHVKLACAACHRPTEGGRGASVVRYKPLGVECIDCHRPTDAKFRPRGDGKPSEPRTVGNER
jgi:mono/diheme cytochrome c family protein